MIGKKYDGAKPRWCLLPIKQVEDVVKVLTFGAIKYNDNNWKYVKDAKNRYYSAAMRHLKDWKLGKKTDKEWKLPHLAHAVCCLLFIMWLDDK